MNLKFILRSFWIRFLCWSQGIRQKTLAGTHCGLCDGWILRNPQHAPIPVCQECWSFTKGRAHVLSTILGTFHTQAEMWIHRMQVAAGATPEQQIESAEQEAAQEVAEDDQVLLSLQAQLGRAIERNDKAGRAEAQALIRAELHRPNPTRKMHAQLLALLERSVDPGPTVILFENEVRGRR